MAITQKTVEKSSFDQPKPIIDESEKQIIENKEKYTIRKNKKNELEAKLLKCPKGGKGKIGKINGDKYETICKEIIELTFANSFKEFQIIPQHKNLSSSKRRDFSLKNSPLDTHQNCVWNLLKSSYQAESIIFECKNIGSKIKKEHVTQLWYYLGSPIGKFGVILTRFKKLTKNAISALGRIEKDKYKIWVLDDTELLKILDCYVKNDNVTDYFSRLFTYNNQDSE